MTSKNYGYGNRHFIFPLTTASACLWLKCRHREVIDILRTKILVETSLPIPGMSYSAFSFKTAQLQCESVPVNTPCTVGQTLEMVK